MYSDTLPLQHPNYVTYGPFALAPENLRKTIVQTNSINFLNPTIDKPGNLKNSAVLRMLEEEEKRQRNGFGPGNDNYARPLRENITWPPPEYEHKNVLRSTFKDVVTSGAKRVAWPPPNDTGFDGPYSDQQQQQQQQQPPQQQQQQQQFQQQQPQQHSPIPAKGGPQYPSQAPSGFQQNTYQAPTQTSPRSPLRPLDISQHGASPLASPVINQSPQGFRPATPSKGWAPVHSPVGTSTQPSWQQSTTRYQAAHQSVSQQTFLGQQYTPGSQSYQSTAQQYQPQHPPQQYQASLQQYQAPPQQYQAAPQQQYQAPPQQQYQAPPQQQYQAPPQQQYQASPQQQYQAPPQQQYQAPPQQQYQAPPQQQYQAPPQQQYQAPPQQQYQTPSQQHYQAAPQQYQATPQQNQVSSQQSYSQSAPPQSIPKQEAGPAQVAPAKQTKPFEPPPTTITLRPQAPVSQAPAPLVTSQPATATLKVNINPKNLRGDLKWPPEPVKKKMLEEAANVDSHNSFLSLEGGKHLRGDLKWPPENVRQQMAEEHRLLLELAQGPACRPARPNKDYTPFFAAHALNSMYPGYKIPPGTQFYRPVE